MIIYDVINADEISQVINAALEELIKVINGRLGGSRVANVQIEFIQNQVDSKGKKPFGKYIPDEDRFTIQIFPDNIITELVVFKRLNREFGKKNMGFFVEFILAHELSHVWFTQNCKLDIVKLKLIEAEGVCVNEALTTYEVFADNCAKFIMRERYGCIGAAIASLGIILHRENRGDRRNELLRGQFDRLDRLERLVV